jgi:hypothetical protein
LYGDVYPSAIHYHILFLIGYVLWRSRVKNVQPFIQIVSRMLILEFKCNFHCLLLDITVSQDRVLVRSASAQSWTTSRPGELNRTEVQAMTFLKEK